MTGTSYAKNQPAQTSRNFSSMTVTAQFFYSRRVIRSFDGTPGIVRERTKTGFRYRLPNGRIVRDTAILERVRSVVIPPAWEEVWICPTADGHIQATGRDARGRKQYRYHPTFRSQRERQKFNRLVHFGEALPAIRKRVRRDLARRGLPKEKVLAVIVSLLDRTHLRLGNAEYVRANGSYGLSTLLARHVRLVGGVLWLRFRGKSGKWHERKISDRTLVQIVRSCRRLPGRALFQYRSPDGTLHRISAVDVNTYITSIAGGHFTAKDFRTWAGSAIAISRLMCLPPPASKTEAKKALIQVFDQVAADLGNTRAVCRKSYIHPSVPGSYLDGSLPQCPDPSSQAETEKCLLELLRCRKKDLIEEGTTAVA